MYANKKDASFNVNKSQEPLCRGAKEKIRLMKRNEPKYDKNKEQVEESVSIQLKMFISHG